MPSADFSHAVRLIYSRLNSAAATDDEVARAQPVFIILSGLPGTGKSTIARAVGRALPAIVVESDFVRKSLFPQPDYSAQESRFTHAVCRAVARQLLKKGYSVISDATNLKEWHRSLLVRIAEQSSATTLIVQLTAPQPVIRARLRHRFIRRLPDDHSDANWTVYELLLAEVQTIKRKHLRIDTSRALDTSVERIVAAARRVSRPSHRASP